MGSFSSTCALSGLPIEAGDRIRFLILTENPFREGPHSIGDLWFPRAFPLIGKYNDYGSIEKIEGEAGKLAWSRGFDYDLVERGYGDNTAHDVPVSKGMGFEALLEAMWEKRVRVRPDFDYCRDVLGPRLDKVAKEANEALGAVADFENSIADTLLGLDRKKQTPEGVPTRKRVERLLREADFMITGPYTVGGYMVDREKYGSIRIRSSEYGHEGSARLQRLVPVLEKHYAVMITCGSGRYAMDAELLVRPKPNPDKHLSLGGRRECPKSLSVQSAMIREDVWNELGWLKVRSWRTDKELDLNHFIDNTLVAWNTLTAEEGNGRLQSALRRTTADGGPECEGFFYRDPIGGQGLGTAFSIMAGLYREGKMPVGEVETFVHNASQFAKLHVLLSDVRYLWQPSYSNGPQFGQWDLHKRVTATIAKVASRCAEVLSDREE